MKTIKVQIEFDIGQTVYLKTDADQIPRLVISISLRPKDIVYGIQNSTAEASYHYGFEISDEKDVMLATTN